MTMTQHTATPPTSSPAELYYEDAVTEVAVLNRRLRALELRARSLPHLRPLLEHARSLLAEQADYLNSIREENERWDTTERAFPWAP